MGDRIILKKKFLLSVCFLFLGAYFPIFAEDLFPDVEPVEKEMPGKKPKADDDKKPGEKTEESTEEEEYNATLNIDVMLTSKVRNSITMAVHNLRITALNDEANLFFPPTRHKKIVDYTTREYVRRSCSICASGGKHETRESKVAIYKYEYEYYDTLKRVKGHSMTTSSVGRSPGPVETSWMAVATSRPLTTLPNSEYCGGRFTPDGPLTMKNWLPLVLGPALARAMGPIS